MTWPTLHRVLWGPTSDAIALVDWSIRTWEVPAVGLPARVATALFAAARNADVPAGWDATHGPLTWELHNTGELLAIGRRLQFEMGIASPTEDENSLAEEPSVLRSTSWEVEPHPAYYLPLTSGAVDDDRYVLYCDILLLLTAMDGGEAILDWLAESGAGIVPFEDRWAWRSRIHLPMEAWQQIERGLEWSGQSEIDGAAVGTLLGEVLRPWTPCIITLDDFRVERVDVRLDTSEDVEIVRTVRLPGSADDDLPPKLLLTDSCLKEKLVVRMGQISARPKTDLLASFPNMDSQSASRTMEQVAGAFYSADPGEPNVRPDLVVFPEVSIPRPEVGTLRELVRKTGIAALAGLYWHALPPVYASAGPATATKAWFVNEAELAIPVGHGDRGPTEVRWYRVRKPVPAHIETGLAQALSTRRHMQWAILKGHRWYRFLHPYWGDFSISICADLLDTAPWRSLRGELLHLFQVAYNPDVELFDSLTWIRAYENYVNLVAVNHGRYGGSFVWTPRRRHERELARLRGARLSLIADVNVPVRALFDAQKAGVQDAVDAAACRWTGTQHPSTEFKSPPPGFERGAKA